MAAAKQLSEPCSHAAKPFFADAANALCLQKFLPQLLMWRLMRKFESPTEGVHCSNCRSDLDAADGKSRSNELVRRRVTNAESRRDGALAQRDKLCTKLDAPNQLVSGREKGQVTAH